MNLAPAIHPLRDRVAVVTGASSGIGAATARRLAAGGAAVALIGRREDRVHALAAELEGSGARALAVPADVTELEAMRAAATRVSEGLGRVSLVVANAGVMLAAPYDRADAVEWERMVDVNLRGVLWTGRVFLADLLAEAAEGRPADLVHVGSIAGATAYPHYGVYSATKAAVAQLTAGLRVELGPRGVRIRTVQPGLVPTELGADMLDTSLRDAQREMLVGLQTLEPEDIAEVIAFATAAPPRMNIADVVVVATQQG
jgi:NADP-dependent 3-hydroxy acid dehydrogenase YdfG